MIRPSKSITLAYLSPGYCQRHDESITDRLSDLNCYCEAGVDARLINEMSH